MKVSRGDVVLLDFPFSDASGSKVRPAVVVQNDALNRRLDSTIVALVTKTLRPGRRPTVELVVRASSPEGIAAGLRFDSTVVCAHVFTVHKDYVHFRIGRLPSSLLSELDDCLKAALGIA